MSDENDIDIVVVASAGKGKTTMCELITEILSAHGFNVECRDEDYLYNNLQKSSIDIINEDFERRLKAMKPKNFKVGISSKQKRRKSP